MPRQRISIKVCPKVGSKIEGNNRRGARSAFDCEHLSTGEVIRVIAHSEGSIVPY